MRRDLFRRRIGVADRAIEEIDAAAQTGRALGGGIGALSDLLDGADLLVRTPRDRGGDIGDAADDVADLLHRRDRRADGRLDFRDLRGDVAGRHAGALRQRLDFTGDDGEAAPALAGARRLDGGVEREQAGLT